VNSKKPFIQETREDRIFNGINIVLMTLTLLIFLFPIYFLMIASFSEPYAVANGKVFFRPVGFSLDAYKYVFQESRVWVGYRNSLYYTVFGTLLNLMLTIPAGYVLSKRNLLGKGFISAYFIIPMYIGGGLVPTYLNIKNLGLLNQPYTLIIIGGLSIYNMIVTRVFFQTTIPEEMYESARMEGASELRIFIQIAVPLSKAIIAVMALFYAVGRWNSYFDALIYITKPEYMPLQITLRSILLLNQNAMSALTDSQKAGLTIADAETMAEMARRAYIDEAMKYSLIIVAALPMLIAYPFVQKFFVQGVMIGSLKG